MKRARSSSSFIDLEAAIIKSFLATVGGDHTPNTARQYLVSTDWRLDDAIQLFYAANESPCSSTNNIVRPPLPVRRDTLYGEPDSFSDSDDDENLWESEDDLSRPPLDLMFHGSFEKAKEAALANDKWLMVNLQSATEFTSHMLNRHTWAHEVVDQVIRSCFVFWQKYDHTTEAKKVKTYYRLDSLPAVVVIDPLTGQRMKSCRGMVEPESLLEDLVQFTDSTPAEHHAAVSRKRRRLSEVVGEERHAPMDEVRSSEDEKEPELMALPEEPNADPGRVCRVGVRLPDGRRFQRNFRRSDPVQMLWSFCNAKFEVEGGLKGFRLVFAVPGASKSLDYGSKSTFEESGLADSLISLVWK